MRFPEFYDNWEEKQLGDITEKINSGKTPLGGESTYRNEGILFIRSQNVNDDKLDLENAVFISTETNAGMKNSIVKANDILLNITGASLGRSCVVPDNFEIGNVNQHVCIIRLREGFNSKFIQPILASQKGQAIFQSLQTGSGREGLNFESIKGITLNLPSIDEQQKIAAFLTFINKRIETQNKIIEELKLLRSTLRNLLFKRIFKEEMDLQLIKDALLYQQPTNYLVRSTDYSNDSSLVPVLTANKSFVLGYTNEDFGVYKKGNCIIFDDFTMDLKYVDFPFKLKSSAIKILCPRPETDLRFAFEYLSFLNLNGTEHKRHYISEIESKIIPKLDYEKQKIIGDFFSTLDKKKANEITILGLFTKQKQYFLSMLFI